MLQNRLPLVTSRYHTHALLRRAGVQQLVYMTDLARDEDPVKKCRALPKGTIVIFRDEEHPNRLALARELRAVTRKRGQYFLVTGCVRFANKVNADGIHLKDHPSARLRRTVPLVSAAAHTIRSVARARRLGAVITLLSPVFDTTSGGGKRGIGVHRLARLAHYARNPVALGGIGTSNAGKLKGIRLSGLAGITAIR